MNDVTDMVAWLRREQESEYSPLGNAYTDNDIADALEVARHQAFEEAARIAKEFVGGIYGNTGFQVEKALLARAAE